VTREGSYRTSSQSQLGGSVALVTTIIRRYGREMRDWSRISVPTKPVPPKRRSVGVGEGMGGGGGCKSDASVKEVHERSEC